MQISKQASWFSNQWLFSISNKSIVKTIRLTLILLVSGAAFFVSAGKAIADTCAPYNPNADYQLVFEENFNGNGLDTGKWNKEFLWGPGVIINNELQYYVNDDQFDYEPFNVSNGTLKISAIKTPFRRDVLYLTRSIYSASAAELLWRVPAGAVRIPRLMMVGIFSLK